jgi:3-oxoacyl-[acyl-carrier-protein] synthase-3
MSLFSINNVKIDSIAACVPTNINKISDYELLSEYEKKIFINGTGVVERRFAPNEICASDLCFAAANEIIKQHQVDKSEIDFLIFVSQSPDYYLPATSILLQERLGLSKSVVAFDVNLGCSGYVYGLSIIANMLSLNGMRKGLLLCGDKSSSSLSYTDKSTYPLFGDAGTATLLSRDDTATPMYFNLQTDGSGKDAIIISGGGTRNPMNETTLKKVQIEPGIERSARDLALNGIDVFNFSLREVKPNVVDLVEFAAIDLDKIDFLVMHQANKLMNESVRKKLKIESEKVPYSLEKFGNTSSASIPLTIVTQLKDKLKNNNKMLLSGFGVGFSWGTVALDFNNVKILKLLEI